MVRRQWCVRLEAPRERLFSYLSDPRHRLDWQSSLVALDIPEQGPPALGTRWREVARGVGAFDMSISEWVENHRWAEHGESHRAKIDLALQFSGELPDETTVTVELQIELRGLLRWAEPLAGPILQVVMNADLRRAARLARE